MVSGTVVAQWLRYCATNQKVAGSIPDGVIRIFHWHNPFDRTMALGLTQPLTEMSTRNLPGDKGGRCLGLTVLHQPVPLSWNLGTLTSWTPLGHSRPVTGLPYLLPFRYGISSLYSKLKLCFINFLRKIPMNKKFIRNLSIDLTKIYSLFKLFSEVMLIKYEVKLYRVHNFVWAR
jgi:hypothetical protein